MIKIDHKKKTCLVAGSASDVVEEISVAMTALLENAVQEDEDVARAIFNELATNLAIIAAKIHSDHKVDLTDGLDDLLEEAEKTEEEEEGCYVSFKKTRKEKK